MAENEAPVSSPTTARQISSQNSLSHHEENETENPVPMELAVSQPVTGERRGPLKKLFLKVGTKFGMIKTTEFSKEYLDAVKNLDQYKEVVSELCHAIMLVCQPNPKLVSSSFSKMEFESPKDADPYEKLAAYLSLFDKHFVDEEAQAATIEVCKNLGTARRNFQQRVCHTLHFMRTFLNIDCANIDKERRVLVSCRQEMDFSFHECTNDPSEGKKANFERAQQRFNVQMSKIFELLGQVQQKENNHADDLLTVLAEINLYHTACYEECQKLREYRAKLDSTTPREML
ncbi:BAR domain-containing protein [Aphelenchoides bicaudatus]|nr:BAR domain-containing protein [Aphelenchoides bicaudatus]